MSIWLLVLGCAIVTAAIKAVGPVALGGRDLPESFNSVIALMAAALLSALVVTSALANDDRWSIGADTAGVAVAGRRFIRVSIGQTHTAAEHVDRLWDAIRAAA